MNILFYDTETGGLPNRNRDLIDASQPHLTQLGFLFERDGKDDHACDTLIKPYGPHWNIGAIAQALTGITPEQCEANGRPIESVMDEFVDYAAQADVLVCHNVAFDMLLMQIQAKRLAPDMESTTAIFEGAPHVCTMLAALPICRLPKKDRKVGYKWPKLEEAIWHFFGEKLDGAHDAMVDITATQRLFRHLCNIGAMDKPMEKIDLVAPRYAPDPRANWRAE
jgi:DNA polymerase-3 subunit epsilon